jgi:hypothetical protein
MQTSLLPEKYQETELWFLFKKSEFYEVKYIEGVIFVLKLIQNFSETKFYSEKLKNDFFIFEEAREENGITKYYPYIVIGNGLHEARIYSEKTEIRYELNNEVKYLSTNETLELLENWLEILKKSI